MRKREVKREKDATPGTTSDKRRNTDLDNEGQTVPGAKDYFGARCTSIAEAYRGFLGDADALDLQPELALTRSHLRALANLADEILSIGSLLLPKKGSPEERLSAILEHYARIQRPLTLLNASLTTFDRIARTVSKIETDKRTISSPLSTEILEEVLAKYYKAVREVIPEKDVARQVNARFLQSFGHDAWQVEPVLRDIEGQANKNHSPDKSQS